MDEESRVVGVIGDHDLLARGLLSESVRLHKVAGPEALQETLRALTSNGAIVGDVMTAPAVTVRESMRLPDAARLMHERHRKRLPVVDVDGRLVGVLGRLDILTSIGSGYARRTAPRSIRLPQEHRTVGEIMERDIPTVAPTTPLGDDPVITALTLSATQHLKRLPVVDAAGRLVGVVARPALLAASLDV